MSYIRYKRFGKREYAYEVTSYWDTERKKPRQKVKYIGVVDHDGKVIEKKITQRDEKLILDFGDTYLLYEFIKRIKFDHTIDDIFGDIARKLLPHMLPCMSRLCYELCKGLV